MNHRTQKPAKWHCALFAAVLAGFLVGFGGPAIAELAQPSKTVDIETVNIHTWKLDPAKGWSVQKLIGKKVKSSKGEDVARVDNIVFGPDGRIHQLIVSTFGVFGFGEKNLAVSWSDVTVGPGYEYVTTPITAESVKKYGLFDGFPKSSGPIAPRDWRSSELIGNYVNLKGSVHYAYVRDLVVSKDGELQAVIVTPDVGYNAGLGPYYAYPFHGHQYEHGYGHHEGWTPGDPFYNLPYTKADIADVLPYAYRK